MDLVAKLPAMEDAALTVLHQNAQRLEHTGTKTQKSAAAALLPAIESELATRRAAKLEAARTKRAATKSKTATAKSKTATAKPKAATAKTKGASSRSKTAAVEEGAPTSE